MRSPELFGGAVNPVGRLGITTQLLMSKLNKKLRIEVRDLPALRNPREGNPLPARAVGLLCAVALLAIAMVGCHGFFVDPTLTSMTITPSNPSLQNVDQTMQLTATGVFDDGSTKNLTASSSTTWSSSDPMAVTVSNTGVIKAVSVASGTSVTISATNTSSNGTASGTVTVCVGSSCTSSNGVTISPATTSYSLSTSQGQAITFTASVNGSNVSASWSSSNSAVIGFVNAAAGTAQIVGQGTTTITAQTSSGTGTLTITVGP